MSFNAVVFPAPGAPRSAVTRPARTSKDTSSTAGGSSLRGLLVNPMAWITHSKIARHSRFFGHLAARLGQLSPNSRDAPLRGSIRPVRPRGAASAD